jgi:transcriptional regulator with XRE-family HTH domain
MIPLRKKDFCIEHELSAWLSHFRLNKLNSDVSFSGGKGRALAETPWSQRAVAKRAGISSANLCQYEKQRATPGSFEIWERWARALGLRFSAKIIVPSTAETSCSSPIVARETSGAATRAARGRECSTRRRLGNVGL